MHLAKTQVPAFYITASALVFDAALYTHAQSVLPPSSSKLNALSQSHIPAFERFVTKEYSNRIAVYSDAGTVLLLAAPLLMLLNKKIDKPYFVVHYSEALSLCVCATLSSKTLLPRYRPYAYNLSLPQDVRQTADARQSFFSLHTGLAASASFYTASYLSHTLRSRGTRIAVWTSAIVLPALVGYSRIASGRHFVTDVATGYVVGAACGVGTYYFSR